MSRRGTWQLNKLILRYCEYSGSSRGVRELLTRGGLHAFAEKNPQLAIEVVPRPGRHPFAAAEYVMFEHNRTVDLKNKSAQEVATLIGDLRNTIGRRTSNPINRHVTKQPSIQGKWAPDRDIAGRFKPDP